MIDLLKLNVLSSNYRLLLDFFYLVSLTGPGDSPEETVQQLRLWFLLLFSLFEIEELRDSVRPTILFVATDDFIVLLLLSSTGIASLSVEI